MTVQRVYEEEMEEEDPELQVDLLCCRETVMKNTTFRKMTLTCNALFAVILSLSLSLSLGEFALFSH